jgi:hypothetical protein
MSDARIMDVWFAGALYSLGSSTSHHIDKVSYTKRTTALSRIVQVTSPTKPSLSPTSKDIRHINALFMFLKPQISLVFEPQRFPALAYTRRQQYRSRGRTGYSLEDANDPQRKVP